jgi:hypothetical protein
MIPQTTTGLLCCMMLLASLGCHVNRASTKKSVSRTVQTAAVDVHVTGPCSITVNGSIAWTATPRPDGDLLSTQTERQLAAHELDAWARAVTSEQGGSTGRIRSIVGPYRLKPTDTESPVLYDVTLEVWSNRTQN